MIRLKKLFVSIGLLILFSAVSDAQSTSFPARTPIHWYLAPIAGSLSEMNVYSDYEPLLCSAIEIGIYQGKNQYSMQARAASGIFAIFGTSPAYQMESLQDIAVAYQYKLISLDNVMNLSAGGGLLWGTCRYRGRIIDSTSTGGFFSFKNYEYDYDDQLLFGLNARATLDLLLTRYVGFTLTSQANIHRHPEYSILFGLKIGHLRGKVPSDKPKSGI